MKKALLSLPVILLLCAGSLKSNAQSATAFAITGESKGNVNWSVIREINLSNGALVRNIYMPATEKPVHIDAATGKTISYDPNAATNTKGTPPPCTCQSPSLAAATAYDKKQQRLYFTTLFGNDLQYIDMTRKDLRIYHVPSPMKAFVSEAGEADNLTRMVFGSDGNGYAITNNGNHFIRITTGKSITIKDLGSLTDKANNGVSIHAQAESWGGDLVADDAGSLYLFTVAAHVFKINTVSLEAEYLGTIKNLASPFSVNAAAVDKSGNVTVASSLDASSYYSVNMKTLEASAVSTPDKMYNASDFANSNLLVTDKTVTKVTGPVAIATGEAVSVYPNPVTNKIINLYFNGSLQGKHTIEVLASDGKRIATRSIVLSPKVQTETLHLPTSTSGMYTVHVFGANNKDVFSANLMVNK